MEQMLNPHQLQSMSETIAAVIGLDVEIIDFKLKRLAATGCMAKNIGLVQQSGWLNKKVLTSGEGLVVTKPGRDKVCNGCIMQRECGYQAGMLAPIFFDNQVFAVLNIVGFSDKQARTFRTKLEVYRKFSLLLAKLIQLEISTQADPLLGEAAVAQFLDNIDKGLIILESNGNLAYVSDKAKKILDKHCLFSELVARQETAKHGLNKEKGPGLLIGGSPGVVLIKRQIGVLADQDTTVLIAGDSGTGKELVAKMIHYQGRRRSYPFVDINCAALPENLVESELFGYTDGAFTGARRGGSVGKVELADKGTLFLDEIGDMPLSAQAKLLRFLEERELYRVGSNKPVAVDVRVIAATNRDLGALVQEGRFRKDLYYRLNIVPVNLPALQERREDIPALARHFADYYCQHAGKKALAIDKQVMDLFLRYEWPGNVRELRNAVEHAVIFSSGALIDLGSLPKWLTDGINGAVIWQRLDNYKENNEREFLIQACHKYGHDKKLLASALNISLTTLYRKLNKFNLR